MSKLNIYQKYKLKKEINERYTALEKHRQDRAELQKYIAVNYAEVAGNAEKLKLIESHTEHIARLQKEIEDMEDKL